MKIILFYALVLIIGLMGLGYMHEQVHVAIYRGYGIESHVEYFSHFPDFVTIAEEGCYLDSCILAHDINEIVGYPIIVLYVIFSTLFFALLCYKQEEKERAEAKGEKDDE